MLAGDDDDDEDDDMVMFYTGRNIGNSLRAKLANLSDDDGKLNSSVLS